MTNPVLTMKPNFTDSLKSRKENIPEPTLEMESTPLLHENTVRIISQPVTTTTSGTKRQRVVTPAASKVIDNEDEPRTSPSIRMRSLGSTKQDVKENERKVLGGIENV